jgi:hypothetical protein
LYPWPQIVLLASHGLFFWIADDDCLTTNLGKSIEIDLRSGFRDTVKQACYIVRI